MSRVHVFQEDCLVADELSVEDYWQGRKEAVALRLVHDVLGRSVFLPMMVARGREPGPTFGITAAVHGNELNGIRLLQRLFAELDPERLRGTVAGIFVVNVPGYLRQSRHLYEGDDLNRLMPGKENGNASEIYAHRFLHRFVRHLDYLVDLHTASFGRVNSLYVRANLNHEVAKQMALLQSPDIIVHNEATDGTVRGAAMDLGIPAITLEIGNPHRFQKGMIGDSLQGVKKLLAHFGMAEADASEEDDQPPIVCRRSFWIHADRGGTLEVEPDVCDRVALGQVVARVRNVFGKVVSECVSPEDGIVVGKATNPACETGARVVHLGVGSDKVLT